jgi:toxin ParE1/3/4|tara:strand:- start:1227 stop:1529 length:303 start_codon:yes stop_codon:yes gene_type:complete
VAKIVVSSAARADLAEIDAYSVRHFGEDAADAYLRGFNAAFEQLRQYPLAGVAQEELGPGIRCLTHRRHRIFHVVKDEIVLIVRIVHHAQNARRVHLDRN